MSRFRTGDLVEVRRREEILATLDARGCLDGMPFMPEMLAYCGRRMRVSAVAHKSCDVARQTLRSRRLDAAVHLEGARCDGSAHGGCEAECNLFWKDAWLAPVSGPRDTPEVRRSGSVSPRPPVVTVAGLGRLTVIEGEVGRDDAVYSCQATQLFDATRPLAWWDPRQYVRDVISRNHRLGHVLGVLLVAFLKHVHVYLPRGYRITRRLYVGVHRRVFRRELPLLEGQIPLDQPTPVVHLGLAPGERVRIRPQEAIQVTLDVKLRNRGMSVDVECAAYCGEVVTVKKQVHQVIEEGTGKMRTMKTPCVLLEGVVCRGEYSPHRLLCPRGIPSFWREAWLERVGEPGA